MRAELLRSIHQHHLLDVRGGWRAAQWLSRGLTSHPVTIDGLTLYVNLEGLHGHALQLLSDPAKYEPVEQALLRSLVRPGDTVYDIGANLGVYSVMFSALVGPFGRVLAFEPNPSLTSNLLRTAAGIPHLKVLDCALADMPGEMQFFVPEDHQMGSLRDWTKQGTVRMVPVRTLDQLPSQPEPDLVKMDVEGAELLVLRGAERWWSTLANPPIIFFEQAPKAAAAFGYDATEVQSWFRERGMRIFEIAPDGLRRAESIAGYANLLAVPECRMERL